MLNPSPEQVAVGDAVVNGITNNLTVALPGSGKSTTCIAAVVRLISTHHGAKPHMISFSAAAAGSINSKLQAMLAPPLFARVSVSTFHAVLFEQYRRLPDARELIMGAHQTGVILRAIEKTREPMDLEEAKSTIENETRQLKLTNPSPITKAYMAFLERYKQIDFNLLCRDVVAAMDKGVIKPLNVTHMIVDEFQDCDEVQLRWMYHHHLGGVKITAVGDDDQSIYGFRGALGFDIMERFAKEFDARTFFLSNCFRCGRNILQAAQKIIEVNEQRIPKQMNAISKHEGVVSIIDGQSREDCIANVADRILATRGEWAVLGRNGAHLDNVELMLNMKEIRCKRIGGKSIWDTPAANSTLHIMQLILDQSLTKDSHIGLSYLLKLDNETIESMESHRNAHLAEVVLETRIPQPQKTALLALVSLAADTAEPAKIKERIEKLSSSILAVKPSKMDAAIFSAILRIVAQDNGTWLGRLEKITSRLRSISKRGQIELDATVVALTTLHGSKGLEWDNVAIIELTDGIFPGKKIGTIEGLEEERRLMFVGMTRAKKNLDLHFYGTPNIYVSELMLEMEMAGEAPDNQKRSKTS